jgi:trans-aconitate 2-methyltransferase
MHNAGMPDWDDAQYLKFADERTRPARELLERVPVASARRVVDLGCGPGNSTALLQARWPDAQLTGVDDSAEMLKRARQELPNVEWIEADAGTYAPNEPVDVLFSNALLQWLPAHERLVPRLLSHVRPGGALAFQVPYNFNEPSHRAMRETPGPWASRTAAVRTQSPVSAPAFYYDLLAPSASSVDIWQTRYEHVMADATAIVEWVKGTGLRPYLEALTPSERPLFLEAYTRAIDAAYPPRRDGKRLFSFPRLFVVAVARGAS